MKVVTQLTHTQMTTVPQPVYARSLVDLLAQLPAHVSPAVVQSIAHECSTMPSDFASEHPHAYALMRTWHTYRRTATSWTHTKMNAFYDWCKQDTQRRARLDAINGADKASRMQMQHAGRAIGKLCDEFEREPGATRQLRPRKGQVLAV